MTEHYLTADRVDKVIKKCLSGEENIDSPDTLRIAGIVHEYAFSKIKLEKHRKKILKMLAELPHEFRAEIINGTGGGWSFLNACTIHPFDDQGYTWGEHLNVERLVCLGIGIDAVTWLMPRAMWAVLPGGMPYFQIKAGVLADVESEVSG